MTYAIVCMKCDKSASFRSFEKFQVSNLFYIILLLHSFILHIICPTLNKKKLKR